MLNIGLTNAAQTIGDFAEDGNLVLSELRKVVTAPEQRKQLRTWGIAEAAKMIGRSPNYLRMIEGKDKLLGEPSYNESGRRIYSLERINWIRDKLNTRYQRPTGSKPIRIAISIFKGGAGKTTTACHLAQRCALDGLRVLVVDIDPQATLTFLFGYIPDLELSLENTIAYSLTDDPADMRTVVQPTYFTGIDIIPANITLQDVELVLPNPDKNNQHILGSPVARLDMAIKEVEQAYDVVILDCAPNLGILTLNALYAANSLLIPIPPEMPDFSSSVLYCRTLQKLLDSFDHNLEFFRILITRHSGTNEANRLEALLRQVYGEYVLTHHMVQTVEIEKATNDLGTVYEIDTHRGSKEAYRRALMHLDNYNGEIIGLYKALWEQQAKVG